MDETKNGKILMPKIKPKKKGARNEPEEMELIDLHTPNGFSKIKKVERDTLMAEIILSYPQLSQDLMDAGMHCVGCPLSSFESLEDGCTVHGMSEEQIDALILRLNEQIKKFEAEKK